MLHGVVFAQTVAVLKESSLLMLTKEPKPNCIRSDLIAFFLVFLRFSFEFVHLITYVIDKLKKCR